MEEINRELFDAYKLAEQELEEVNAQLIEACKIAEQKMAEIKKRLQAAAIPAKENAVGAIRDLLLGAPDAIGKQTYKGDKIPQDECMAALTICQRDFKSNDILLLTKDSKFTMCFTENAFYIWVKGSPKYLKATYSQIKSVSVNHCIIDIKIPKYVAPKVKDDQTYDSFSLSKIMSFHSDASGFHFIWDTNVEYLYNLISDLKEAAEDTV